MEHLSFMEHVSRSGDVERVSRLLFRFPGLMSCYMEDIKKGGRVATLFVSSGKRRLVEGIYARGGVVSLSYEGTR